MASDKDRYGELAVGTSSRYESSPECSKTCSGEPYSRCQPETCLSLSAAVKHSVEAVARQLAVGFAASSQQTLAVALAAADAAAAVAAAAEAVAAAAAAAAASFAAGVDAVGTAVAEAAELAAEVAAVVA